MVVVQEAAPTTSASASESGGEDSLSKLSGQFGTVIYGTGHADSSDQKLEITPSVTIRNL